MWKDTPSCKLKQTNVLQFDWLQVSFTKTRHKEGCINQLYPWYKAFLLSCQACKIPPPAFTSAHGLVRTTELNSTNTTEVRQPNSCRCDVSWASDVSSVLQNSPYTWVWCSRTTRSTAPAKASERVPADSDISSTQPKPDILGRSQSHLRPPRYCVWKWSHDHLMSRP